MRVLIAATQEFDDRKTLCAVRSLGRAGFDVTIASDAFNGRSFHSRFGKKRFQLPNPARDPDAFISELKLLLQQQQFDVLLPTTDRTTLLLARHQAELAPLAAVPVPPADAAERCKDKARLTAFARELALPVPETFSVADESVLGDIMGRLEFPVVLKPNKGAGGAGASVIHSAEELRRLYRALPRSVDDVYDFEHPLVQQFIPGEVHEVNALFEHGKPLLVMSQKRLLRYPRCGAGIYNITTDEPDLVEPALKLLAALKWNGPAQVEFLRHERSRKPYLLEVNGRFWGTMDMAVAAGLDFPAQACRMAVGQPVPVRPPYRVGLRYRWPFPYALLHAMETGHWWGAFRDLVLPGRAKYSDISLGDPMPLVMEIIHTLRRYYRQGFSRLDTSGKIRGCDD